MSDKVFPPINDDAREKRPIPTYRGLFRFYDHSDLFILVPAFTTSFVSGVLIPAFTILLGLMFSSFSNFSNGDITRTELRVQITSYVIGVSSVGVAAWVLGWINMSLWLTFGENTAKKAREQVLKGLLKKDMAWFDEKVVNDGIS